MRATILVVVALVTWTSGTIRSHHSAADIYDVSRRTAITGTVVEARLINPHSDLFITVTAGGTTRRWAIELPGAFTLTPYWTATTLEAGDSVTATGWPARDDSARMFGRSVVTAAGIELMPGSVNRDRYVELYRREREAGR